VIDGWNSFVADVADHVPGGVAGLGFLLLIGSGVISLLLYLLPYAGQRDRRERDRSAREGRSRRRGFRAPSLRGLRWRWRWRLKWRRRGRRPGVEHADLPADELPDLPASLMAATADELAAQGRFAEAVRERLRSIVKDLIERGVIPRVPGWTVTELAAAAVTDRPALAVPVRAAAEIFSEIWYAQRGATAADDMAMRTHAEAVGRVLAGAESVAGGVR
jgi:hypothetical protein